jgi:hypothetical protein
MLPLVLIAPPAEIAPESVPAMLRNCNLVLGRERCVAASDAGARALGTWFATIEGSDADPDRVKIELRPASDKQRVLSARTLSFASDDTQTERWATIGVVVAALVVDATANEKGANEKGAPAEINSPTQSPAAAAPPTPVAPSPLPQAIVLTLPKTNMQAAHDLGLRLDLGGLIGPSPFPGSLQYGLALRPTLELDRGFGVCVALARGAAADGAQATYWHAAAGIAYRLRLLSTATPLTLEGRTALSVQRLGFSAVGPLGEHDAQSTYRVGPLVGVDLGLMLTRTVGAFIGIDLALLDPKIVVRRSGLALGESHFIEVFGLAGLRWRIPLAS